MKDQSEGGESVPAGQWNRGGGRQRKGHGVGGGWGGRGGKGELLFSQNMLLEESVSAKRPDDETQLLLCIRRLH